MLDDFLWTCIYKKEIEKKNENEATEHTPNQLYSFESNQIKMKMYTL